MSDNDINEEKYTEEQFDGNHAVLYNPVYKTGAYFNAMINCAKEGDLHLHNSIFGILQREYGAMEMA